MSSGGAPPTTGTLLFPLVSQAEVPHITEDWGCGQTVRGWGYVYITKVRVYTCGRSYQHGELDGVNISIQ